MSLAYPPPPALCPGLGQLLTHQNKKKNNIRKIVPIRNKILLGICESVQ